MYLVCGQDDDSRRQHAQLTADVEGSAVVIIESIYRRNVPAKFGRTELTQLK